MDNGVAGAGDVGFGAGAGAVAGAVAELQLVYQQKNQIVNLLVSEYFETP